MQLVAPDVQAQPNHHQPHGLHDYIPLLECKPTLNSRSLRSQQTFSDLSHHQHCQSMPHSRVCHHMPRIAFRRLQSYKNSKVLPLPFLLLLLLQSQWGASPVSKQPLLQPRSLIVLLHFLVQSFDKICRSCSMQLHPIGVGQQQHSRCLRAQLLGRVQWSARHFPIQMHNWTLGPSSCSETWHS